MWVDAYTEHLFTFIILSYGKLICIGTENGWIAYRVGIAYSVRHIFISDSRYNPCESAGGRADGDL